MDWVDLRSEWTVLVQNYYVMCSSRVEKRAEEDKRKDSIVD